MKPVKNISFLALACLLLFGACERVIDVDLNTASPRYVIEGTVTDGPGPHQVRITQTKNFDESNYFDGIGTAEVIIADDEGNSEILPYVRNSIYETTELWGVPGRTYTLTVNVGGETFTAACSMPAAVNFDSLYIQSISGFSNEFKIPYASYQDLPESRSYYRHILYVNERKFSSIFISRDERNDGSLIERALPFFGSDEDRLSTGDIVKVEMQTIDRSIYDYFFSLDQTISQDAASPANPVSNISGGALGYFSAHSVQTKTLEVD